MHKQNIKGFTLVELAIVMTIIGLLIGGVLKGQELINQARITSFITDLQSYDAAIVTFVDKYSQRPGDISTANQRIPGCAIAASCFAGNSNGQIGAQILAPFVGDLFTMWSDQTNPAQFPQSETVQFFRHLVLADLITGVNPTADLTVPKYGETHPTTSFGGFSVAYNAQNIGNGLSAGNYLLLTSRLTGGAVFLQAGQMPVSPQIAAQIDRKMDDGSADSGLLISPDATALFGLPFCMPYDETSSNFDCTLAYRFQG